MFHKSFTLYRCYKKLQSKFARLRCASAISNSQPDSDNILGISESDA